jgi:hypothetical protein
MTVHLVNLTNPMMMKGPVREVIPVSNQHVRIQIPNGSRVARAKLLVAGRPIPFTNDHGVIAVDVPSIAVHEVVALDLGI